MIRGRLVLVALVEAAPSGENRFRAGAGQIAEGLAAAEQAIARAERTGIRWAFPESLRIKGELLLSQGATGAVIAAEDHFRQALDWARRQGALSLELRAATSLARLRNDQGGPAEAASLLQPVYDRFSEGFDTADLKVAKALLDALAAPVGAPLPHAVLAAVTDQPGLSGYQRHLAERIRTLGLDATLLTRFDPGVRTLLRHPALRAVVVPSRSEPFGRVPLEAYIAGAAPVVATTAGGLTEQVIDGVTGFTAAPADPASLAVAIERALSMSAAQRERMRAGGRELARTRFDHTLAIRRFLADSAPWACRETQQHPAAV